MEVIFALLGIRIISEPAKNFERLISASIKTQRPFKYLSFFKYSIQFFIKEDFSPSFIAKITWIFLCNSKSFKIVLKTISIPLAKSSEVAFTKKSGAS